MSETATEIPTTALNKWGDLISEERQAELQGYLDRWASETDHGGRKGPFDKTPTQPAGVNLTGADVYWLAGEVRDALGHVGGLHLEGAYVGGQHLVGAQLYGAHLERASLIGSHLEEADLSQAHLGRVSFIGAYLEGTVLSGARLEGALFVQAHLEGANLAVAHLEGADFRGTWLDTKTVLGGITLDNKTKLGDINWSGIGSVNLTQINWEQMPTLGDEQGVGLRAKASEHEAVVRAYRQVAAQLRSQGMSEVADRFLFRAQVRQRGVLLRQGKFGSYLFSLLVLSGLAGYGFRLRRILFAYGLTLVLFAAAYFASGQWLGGTHLEWYESLLVSLTAIHGRVFFTQFGLDNLQSWIAAVESVVGIVIEGVFVAMLIQKFFGR